MGTEASGKNLTLVESTGIMRNLDSPNNPNNPNNRSKPNNPNYPTRLTTLTALYTGTATNRNTLITLERKLP